MSDQGQAGVWRGFVLESIEESDMIDRSLLAESHSVSSSSLAAPLGRLEWERTLPERRRQWLEMLGLDPLPERTPLHATVTGVLDRDDYVVEKIHFQSSSGAYVPANLYRPAQVAEPLPAVLYLCGHTKGKVNPPYQANPRWFGHYPELLGAALRDLYAVPGGPKERLYPTLRKHFSWRELWGVGRDLWRARQT